jgi:hypothetical protein
MGTAPPASSQYKPVRYSLARVAQAVVSPHGATARHVLAEGLLRRVVPHPPAGLSPPPRRRVQVEPMRGPLAPHRTVATRPPYGGPGPATTTAETCLVSGEAPACSGRSRHTGHDRMSWIARPHRESIRTRYPRLRSLNEEPGRCPMMAKIGSVRLWLRLRDLSAASAMAVRSLGLPTTMSFLIAIGH